MKCINCGNEKWVFEQAAKDTASKGEGELFAVCGNCGKKVRI